MEGECRMNVVVQEVQYSLYRLTVIGEIGDMRHDSSQIL
jgi:hypothetical protein